MCTLIWLWPFIKFTVAYLCGTWQQRAMESRAFRTRSRKYFAYFVCHLMAWSSNIPSFFLSLCIKWIAFCNFAFPRKKFLFIRTQTNKSVLNFCQHSNSSNSGYIKFYCFASFICEYDVLFLSLLPFPLLLLLLPFLPFFR